MIDVHIPKFGMSTVEVDVIDVMVKPGDRIAIGDPLIEIESEKATTVVESEHAGVVDEVLVQIDEVYNVGDVICRLRPDD